MINIVVHPTFWDIVLYSKSTIVKKKRKVATQQCSKLITQLTLTLGLELPNKFTKPLACILGNLLGNLQPKLSF